MGMTPDDHDDQDVQFTIFPHVRRTSRRTVLVLKELHFLTYSWLPLWIITPVSSEIIISRAFLHSVSRMNQKLVVQTERIVPKQ